MKKIGLLLIRYAYNFARCIYRVLPIPGALRERIINRISPEPIVIPLSQSVMPDSQWIVSSEPTGVELEEQREFLFPVSPLITLVLPITEAPHESIIELFQSLKAQTYKKWEIHVINRSGKRCSDLKKLCRSDKRINYHFLSKPKIKGEYVGFLMQNYTLAAFALYEIVRLINEKPDADLIYSDEDRINENIRYNPQLKPEYSPDTLLSINYIESFFFVRKELLSNFSKKEYISGAGYFGLVLGICEYAEKIYRIPKILAHKRYDQDCSVQENSLISEGKLVAIQAHTKRQWGLSVTVTYVEETDTYCVVPEVLGTPMVSIIIPNKDSVELLRNCIETIIRLTTYSNYEIVVIENNSENNETFVYYSEIEALPQVRVIYYPQSGFNYYKIINFGVKNCEADFILQLNNDTLLLTPDWLELMLGYAGRDDVGAVGVKLLYPDKSIQHVGGILHPDERLCSHVYAKMPGHTAGYMNRASIIQNVSWVTGACMMSRREIYEQVGFMDEDFAVNLGDLDFCMRIRALGKLIVLNPFVQLIHLEGKTRGFHETPEKAEMYRKEVELFRRKWAKELEKDDPYYNPGIERLMQEPAM